LSERAGQSGATDAPVERDEGSFPARSKLVAISEWRRAVAAFEGDATVDFVLGDFDVIGRLARRQRTSDAIARADAAVPLRCLGDVVDGVIPPRHVPGFGDEGENLGGRTTDVNGEPELSHGGVVVDSSRCVRWPRAVLH
jgi:hypothetical protein